MCELLRGDDKLSDIIYNDYLDSSCKGYGSSIVKTSIGGNLFSFLNHCTRKIVPDKEKNSALEIIDNILELGLKKNGHKLPLLVSMFLEERLNRKKDRKLTDISGSELIDLVTKIQKKLDNNSKIMSLFEKEIYWNTPLFTAFNVALKKFKEDFNSCQKFLLLITDGLANDTKGIKNYTDKIYKSALENDIIVIGIYISDEKKICLL
jgi:hypothetical protein